MFGADTDSSSRCKVKPVILQLFSIQTCPFIVCKAMVGVGNGTAL